MIPYAARRGTAELPLHGGKAPAWLFQRMVAMAGAIGTLIVRDHGPEELLRRLSDPFWFQAFGCVLGFDWHSSGVTTTVCGALKEAARRCGPDLGIAVCGGKGPTARKTPRDIEAACARSGTEPTALIYASRLSAKVDNTAVQDGYALYHHVLVFAPGATAWCVVQQGMDAQRRTARRYHWLSEHVDDFVIDPHAAVACDRRAPVRNLVAREGERHRQALVRFSCEHPERTWREIQPLLRHPPSIPEPQSVLRLPARHTLTLSDLRPESLKKTLLKTYEAQAPDFERLLGIPGLGPQALRALSLICEVVYDAPACRRDPAAYSFAHGGKDGHPYAVNRALYDANVAHLRNAIQQAKCGRSDRIQALRSLARFTASLA